MLLPVVACRRGGCAFGAVALRMGPPLQAGRASAAAERGKGARRRLAGPTAAPRRRQAPRHRFLPPAWTDALVPRPLQVVCSA